MIASHRPLRRFFLSQPIPSEGHRVALTISETRHLRDSLRLRVGDRCVLLDGSGSEAEAEICVFLRSGETRLEVKEVRKHGDEKYPFIIRTVQSMAQKGKMDFLVEKAQELGVDEFWPIETQHSGMQLSHENRSKVHDRWCKKIIQAAKQSGSLKLLQIAPLQSLERAVRSIPLGEPVVIFHPSSEGKAFRQWVQELEGLRRHGKILRLNLFFGPEGGFSEKEIESIKMQRPKRESQLIMVHLNHSILRLETAYLGVVSSMRFLFE